MYSEMMSLASIGLFIKQEADLIVARLYSLTALTVNPRYRHFRRIKSSKIGSQCHDILEFLSERNTVSLVWVPGIQGNEIANELTKKGNETKFAGSE